MAFCTSFQRGERRTGRVRSVRGEIKYFLNICIVLDLYNCSIYVSGVHYPAILQEMVYILFTISLFLTVRFSHQQIRPKIVTLLTNYQ